MVQHHDEPRVVAAAVLAVASVSAAAVLYTTLPETRGTELDPS